MCVPSRREGYGVVAREAMAYGRPVVATAVGGLVDAVEDGTTGLLVPARDPAALRAAVEALLGDAELRARLGRAARERAEREWRSAPRPAPRSQTRWSSSSPEAVRVGIGGRYRLEPVACHGFRPDTRSTAC